MCRLLRYIPNYNKKWIIIYIFIFFAILLHLTLGLLSVFSQTDFFNNALTRVILDSGVFIGEFVLLIILIKAVFDSMLDDDHNIISCYNVIILCTFITIFTIGIITSSIDLGYNFSTMPLEFKIYNLTFMAALGLGVLVIIGLIVLVIIGWCLICVDRFRARMREIENMENMDNMDNTSLKNPTDLTKFYF